MGRLVRGQKRRDLQENLFVMTHPQVTAARVTHEARARDVLGRVTRPVKGAEQVVSGAHDEGGRCDMLQVIA